MNIFENARIILALLLASLLTIAMVSACGIIGGAPEPDSPEPQTATIFAPADNTKLLIGSPVQIQSGHPNSNSISRVELYVSQAGEPERLIRSDAPRNGIVVQEWLPQDPGTYQIRVQSVTNDGTLGTQLTQTLDVIDSTALSSQILAQSEPAVVEPEPTEIAAQPIASPTPGAASSTTNDDGAAFIISTTGGEALEPTPVPRYPPPPPAPGIPPGPVQDQLSSFTAPVCDAAKFVGVFAPKTSNRRVFVTEADDVAAEAVGGTIINRAWRLQNIGTCTWGPGYELSFYGGRQMGSGGVAFESAFPNEPARRNVLIDSNQLIMPEGKPNQTAVLEVLLTVPTTPGIHQSYWRMRNPHGVFFGPILGVTLEVVRDCDFGIYGAPVINQFEILGVGDVFEPANPVDVVALRGQDLTLEWNIINASNFDIVFEDPTGNIQSVSTSDPNSRATFPTGTVGDHVITLFADNGTCTSQAQVNVRVVPEAGSGFSANVAFATDAPVSSNDPNASVSSSVRTGTVEVEWQHFDDAVDEVVLHIDRYQQVTNRDCSLEEWFGDFFCIETDEWRRIDTDVLTVGGEAAGAAAICQDSQACRNLSNTPSNFPVEISSNDHAFLIFCPNTGDDTTGVQFYAEAFKNGGPAEPQFSNTVDIKCSSNVKPVLEFNPD